MDENRFRMFCSTLKIMESEALNNSTLENTIIKIIDVSEKSMNEEQKRRIYDEFVHYERKRREKKSIEKRFAHLEEEKYKRFLDDFFTGKDFLGW